jgi:hypothetical protein
MQYVSSRYDVESFVRQRAIHDGGMKKPDSRCDQLVSIAIDHFQHARLDRHAAAATYRLREDATRTAHIAESRVRG